MAIHLVGATGNIGKRIVEKGGDDINVISRFELKLDQRPLYYNFDAKTIGGTSIKEGDVIIFAAAISEPSVCANQFEKALAVNVESTGEFIETAMVKGCLVIFLSSDAVYGDVEHGFDETQPVNPKGAYASMKAIIEKRFKHSRSFRAFRLSYNFHYNDRFTKYLRECAESGVEAEVFDPLARSIIHRDDTVEAILKVAKDWKLGGIIENYSFINCGGVHTISRAELAQAIQEEALPNLKYKIITPPAKFYVERPVNIYMHSPRLHVILDRPATTIRTAIKKEFGIEG